MTLIKRQRPPKGKLVLRKDAPVDGKYPIILQYCVNGKIAKTTFGYNISESDWDAVHQCVKNSNRSYRALNERLKKFTSEFNCMVLDAFKVRQAITIKEIRFILENKRLPNQKSIIEIGKELLENDKTQNRIAPSTYKNGVCNLSVFENYIKEVLGLSLHEARLGIELVDNYITWRKSARGNTNETINKALTPIIKIAEFMYIKGSMSYEEYDKIKHSYLEPEKLSLNACGLEENIKFITRQNFDRLEYFYNNCKLKRTKEYLEMYKFTIFTGLRFSDIISLEWANIDFDRKLLRKVLVKSKRRIVHSLLISNEAMEILSKWKERVRTNRFVFGLLPNRIDLDDEESLRYFTQTKNNCINSVLKDVFRKLELPPMTFHSSRHTFAIWALNEQRKDIKQISSELGHTSILTTEKYYAKYIQTFIAR